MSKTEQPKTPGTARYQPGRRSVSRLTRVQAWKALRASAQECSECDERLKRSGSAI